MHGCLLALRLDLGGGLKENAKLFVLIELPVDLVNHW